MNLLSILFLTSLLLGQIGGISPWPGVVLYTHDIVLALLIIVSLPGFVSNTKLRHAALLKPITIFIAAAVVSLLANYWRFSPQFLATGSLYLVRWIFYACVYLLVVHHVVDSRFWLKGLYVVGVGFGILGLLQFILYPDLRNLYYLGWDPHYYRVFSTLLDPNFAGVIFVLTLILGFGLWKKKDKNFLLIIGQIISFISLLLTYSRSSYLAFGAAVICLTVWTKQWKVLVALVAFTGLVLLLPHGSTLSLLRSDSTLARVGNWQESLHLIAKAPVFGYGFDTLRYLKPQSRIIISKAAAGLDSSILFIIATTGIVGLLAYAFLIISMIRSGTRTIGPVFLASICALLVHSLFVNSLFYPWVMIWMWILAGVTIYDK